MIDFKKNEIFAITKPKCHLFSAGLITLSAQSKSKQTKWSNFGEKVKLTKIFN